MKKITILFLFIMLVSASAQDVFYNVLDYGAKGDGITNSTKAINSTIDAAAKLEFDMEERTVVIESALTNDAIAAALNDAGYDSSIV